MEETTAETQAPETESAGPEEAAERRAARV